MNLKKIIISLVLGVSILIPNLVLASNVLPDFNPICWTKDDCAKYRQQAYGSGIGDGFFPQEGDCKGGEGESVWGKCSPSAVTELEIKIGGKYKINNIGEYIEIVYNYALGIVGIVAVVVIMVAGVQWIVAGGNSTLISASKKRIGGAMIGLFLAYSSYFILNSINPWLVNFRLPQTWLVKEIQMMTEYCTDMEAIKKKPGLNFALVEDDAKIFELKTEDFSIKGVYRVENKDENGKSVIEPSASLEELECNQTFSPSAGGGGSCVGHYCEEEGNMCIPNYNYKKGNENEQKLYKCEEAMMVVKAYSGYLVSPSCGSFFVEGWEFPFFKQLKLFALCNYSSSNANNAVEVGDFDRLGTGSSKVTYWKIEKNGKINSVCEGGTKLKGFMLLGKMDEACTGDQLNWIGKGGANLGMTSDDTGTDTSASGKSGPIAPTDVSSSQLFTKLDLEKGIYLRIDVAGIEDID